MQTQERPTADSCDRVFFGRWVEEIRPQVMTSHVAASQGLDSPAPFQRNAALLPLRHGHVGNAQRLGERRLRAEEIKSVLKSVHAATINNLCIAVNDSFIAPPTLRINTSYMNAEREIDRVFRLVRETDRTDSEFASAIGASAQVVGNWKRRGQIPGKRIYAIADWLTKTLRRPITAEYLHHGKDVPRPTPAADADHIASAPGVSDAEDASYALKLDIDVIEMILNLVEDNREKSGEDGVPIRKIARVIAHSYPEFLKEKHQYQSRRDAIESALQQAKGDKPTDGRHLPGQRETSRD